MQVGYRQKSPFWSNNWLSKIAGRAKCQKHLPTTKLSIWHSRPRTTGCRSIAGRANYEVTKTVTDDHAVGDAPTNVYLCSMDEYAEEKRTEKNLIVRSGIYEAETTNNKRLRSTFCVEAIQTRSIAQPLCDSRASCPLLLSVYLAFPYLRFPSSRFVLAFSVLEFSILAFHTCIFPYLCFQVGYLHFQRCPQNTSVWQTDRQTDGQTSWRNIVRAMYTRRKNRPISMKFGTLQQIFNPMTVTWPKNEIFKNEDGGRPPSCKSLFWP